MKVYNKFSVFILLAFIVIVSACKKAGSELQYGYSKIYMPQAINNSGGINNNFPIPAGTDTSTYNYSLDVVNKKINVLLGVALSGPGKGPFSVTVSTNMDTINKMIVAGTLDSKTQLMPSTIYSLPSGVNVSNGNKTSSFSLSINIDSLKKDQYAGKKLAIAVVITNPTQFVLDTAHAVTIVIVDVNTLVIGPAVNISSSLVNPGNPFKTSSMDAGGRWGTLSGWTANTAAKSHNGNGGFNTDNGGTMDMESGWGSPQILNGKIYQTVSLLAGSYSFDLSGGNWSGGENFMKDIGYFVIAPGLDTLPDYSDITTASNIYYQQFVKTTQPVISFKLSVATKVTLGAVVSYFQDQQGFKTEQVLLYSYPKHL